jgi:hypothetical protein
MNTNDLKYIWAAPENALPPDRARKFARVALEQVGRERKRRRGLLAFISVMVTVVTIGCVWQMLRREIAWPATAILAAQWITALALWRLFRQDGVMPTGEQSIRDTLEVLLRKVKTRCRELQTMLGLFLLAIPLATLSIFQLEQSGKMRPHEAASASALFGVILFGVTGWLLYDLFARKVPERRHLESLLREYR